MFANRKRSGFTLPEVLVTVAIVAVLAAAVVPTVVNQMSKGEAGAAISDLNSLNAGITAFVTDTRRYPGDLEDLNTRPDGADAILGGGTYSTAAQNAWKGPYLSTTQDLSTGYIFAGLNLKANSALIAPATANGFHITLDIVPAGGGTFTEAQILSIDQTLDGGDGQANAACGTTPSANSTGGRLTWTEAGTPGACTISAVRYRLIPTGS